MTGKLVYKVGDLIEAAQQGEVWIIGHGCNCFNTMGSGIAPQIKYAFPYAYNADWQTEKGDKDKLGTYSLGEPEYYGYDSSLPLVFNLYQQYGYGGRNERKRDLNYNALYDALKAMGEDLHGFDCGDHNRHMVGLPKIGSKLAGGDWVIIEKIIERTLCLAEHDVIVYVLDEDEIPEGSIVIS